MRMTQQPTTDLPAEPEYFEDDQPCGEGMCQCHCGHGHPCGCDCPRCDFCGQRDENCDCED